MGDKGVAFDAASAGRIARVVRQVEDSVRHTGRPPTGRRPSAATILWGLVKTTWSSEQTSPNQIVLNPCDENGDGVHTDLDIPVYIQLPKDTTPVGIALAADRLVAYVPFKDSADVEGVLVGVSTGVPVYAMFAVKVWRDGSGKTDGDQTHVVNRTYTARTMDATAIDTGGTLLGEDLVPQERAWWTAALHYGKYECPAADGGGVQGRGYFNASGTFVLESPNEQRCTSDECEE